MLNFTIQSRSYHVPRHGVLVDTNVVVAKFLPVDEHHETADAFLAGLDGRPWYPVLPVSVLVESWGMLVGSFGSSVDSGCQMLEWAMNPGTATILPDNPTRIDEMKRMASLLQIDLVDAVLLELSASLQRGCSFDSPLPIASFDQRDYLMVVGRVDQTVRLMDVHTFDITDYEPQRKHRRKPRT